MKLFKYIWDENPATDLTLVWAESKEKAIEALKERWKEEVEETNIEEVDGTLMLDFTWHHDNGWFLGDDDQDTMMTLGDFEIDNGDVEEEEEPESEPEPEPDDEEDEDEEGDTES